MSSPCLRQLYALGTRAMGESGVHASDSSLRRNFIFKPGSGPCCPACLVHLYARCMRMSVHEFTHILLRCHKDSSGLHPPANAYAHTTSSPDTVAEETMTAPCVQSVTTPALRCRRGVNGAPGIGTDGCSSMQSTAGTPACWPPSSPAATARTM